MKGTYEKQIQDLEDENERCISDLSNLEKNIDRLKVENAELKSKVVADLNKSSG
jgi:predicted  nucleic acid-binding Zn-ribbon protein